MMKKYEQYKPSGSEWLGDIPAHWEVKKLGHISKIVRGASPRPAGDPTYFNGDFISWITVAEVTKDNEKYLTDTSEYLTEAGMKLSRVIEPNTLLLSNSGATLGVPKITKIRGCINDGSVAFLDFLANVENDFVYYFFKTMTFTLRDMMSGYGQPNLNTDIVKSLSLPLPPQYEQEKIAQYLDHKTAEIDDLIQKKQKLIALLREERTALINEAVTKGINTEGVTFKDSGIEWLGEIPQHWEVKSIKHIVMTKVTDGPHETPNFIPEGVPFVSAEGVKEGKIYLESCRGYISKEQDLIYSKKCKPRFEDIFIVKSGSTTGKIAYVDFEADFNVWSPLALVRVKQNINSRFVFYALSSEYFQKSIQLFWSFGTQPNIGMNVIENLKITLPPQYEQQKIVAYIENETQRIDDLIGKVEKEISLLQEYRTALISEVVTGKVKVVD